MTTLVPYSGTIRGIGIMSGSSLDGVDFAYVQFDLENGILKNYQILEAETAPYDEQWISRLEHLRSANAQQFALTHVMYGHLLGKMTQQFCKKYGIKPDFVSCHGHTIFHDPSISLTFQIGCGQTFVSYLPCPLVNDFRSQDVANGGQGAPLVPLVEKELFPDYQFFLNLGGFANLSFFANKKAFGFDATACNRVLNYYAWKWKNVSYDKDGLLAQTGNFNENLFHQINSLEFFQKKAPKSLGNEWLEAEVFPILDNSKAGEADILRTWVEHIAYQVDNCLKDYENQSILVTGGGAFNSFLMEKISSYLKIRKLKVVKPDEITIKFKESLVFAYLGLKTLQMKSFDMKQITGGRNAILGAVHFRFR